MKIPDFNHDGPFSDQFSPLNGLNMQLDCFGHQQRAFSEQMESRVERENEERCINIKEFARRLCSPHRDDSLEPGLKDLMRNTRSLLAHVNNASSVRTKTKDEEGSKKSMIQAMILYLADIWKDFLNGLLEESGTGSKLELLSPKA